MPWKFRFRNITCIGNFRWCIRGECRLDCFGWDLHSRYPVCTCCVARARGHASNFSPALVFSDARRKDRRACAPPQTHFPWKLTGEISFDDIAAAGGPPDQWDALPTNAKLQIILFIGPRIHRRTARSARALLWHTGAARTVLLVEIEDEFHSKCTNEPRDEYRACGSSLVYVFFEINGLLCTLYGLEMLF